MKKFLTGLVMLVVMVLAVSAASANSAGSRFSCGLATYEVNGRYGYIDTRGQIVIPAQWDYAGTFSSGGYAVVFNGTLRSSGSPDVGSYGLINTKGEYVFEMTPCDGISADMTEQYGIFNVSYEIGDMDWVFEYRTVDGKVLGGRKWENARSGRTIGLPMPVMDENDKWGYMDAEHGLVIPCAFDDAFAFRDGIARVKTTDAKGRETYSYINAEGRIIITGDWDYAGDFTPEGYAQVFRGSLTKYGSPDVGRYGYIDKTGELVCGYEYDRAQDFSEGYAAVAVTDAKGRTRWGYIDTSFRIAAELQWDYAYSFSNGYGRVFNGTMSEYGYPATGLYGYVGSGCAYISEPQWSAGESFTEAGLAIVARTDAGGENCFGMIGTDGQPVISLSWDSISQFSEGRALVSKDGKFGYINEAGEPVIPATWEKAGDFHDGVAIVWDKDSWYIIDPEGKVIF